jgi:AcrR family transcriptional regulator
MENPIEPISPPKYGATKSNLLEAAKSVLLAEGYSGLSTRAIAAAADTQMSQIRYHFGSKEGMVLALYDYMTAQVMDRQTAMFSDKTIPISQKWDIACDYLDADIASGYVRVFQELMALGWSNDKVAFEIRKSLSHWFELHLSLAKEFQDSFGSFSPFPMEDIVGLIGPAFVGVEAFILLGWEDQMPVRQSLRRFGNVIRHFENNHTEEI